MRVGWSQFGHRDFQIPIFFRLNGYGPQPILAALVSECRWSHQFRPRVPLSKTAWTALPPMLQSHAVTEKSPVTLW